MPRLIKDEQLNDMRRIIEILSKYQPNEMRMMTTYCLEKAIYDK
jgi:hypothetical protein